MLKNKPFWITLALLVAYLLAGWILGPRYLQPGLHRFVGHELGYGLAFDKLRFDPLTLSADLSGVQLLPDSGSPWPELAMSAESVHVRFSFWRLRPAVADLVITAPEVQLAAGSDMENSLLARWRQWRSSRPAGTAEPPMVIARWRVLNGRLSVRASESASGKRDLVTAVDLHAGRVKDGGMREFSLGFSFAEGGRVDAQGSMQPSTFRAEGGFEASLPAATPSPVLATGRFNLQVGEDSLQFALTQGSLGASQSETCWRERFLCVRLTPLQASFEARGLASVKGVAWQELEAGLGAFSLDLNLAQAPISLVEQAEFAAASLAVQRRQMLPTASLGSPQAASFDVRLKASGAAPVNASGVFDQAAAYADLQFEAAGAKPLGGSLRLRNLVAQQTGNEYSQLELLLRNPGAALAQEFISRHLGGQWKADGMGLELLASQDDQGLEVLGKLSLEQAGLLADPGELQSAGSDPAWLLALWRDQQGRVEVDLSQQPLQLQHKTTLSQLLEPLVLDVLLESARDPFESLARLAGSEAASLDEVVFAAGTALPEPASAEVILDLAQALASRPGLELHAPAVYDPLIDRKALQAEQVRTHIALAAAADAEFQSGAALTDFSDPVVHSVIDEFARRRLPPDVLAAFFEHFGPADVDQGVIPQGNIADYYATLFELLVNYAEIPQGAMATLARYRAQAVTDGLAKGGVGRERLHAAAEAEQATARVDGVPMLLQLRRYSDQAGPSAGPGNTNGIRE